jgi:hypothetical protein
MATFRCAVCGGTHDELPAIGSSEPYYYLTVPEAERSVRTMLTSDTCVIDNQDFFIRGVIEIPILNSSGTFDFGVWVSLAQMNFHTYLANFHSDEIGPFFGWHSTEIDFYPRSTLSLKTQVHFRNDGIRPLIVLEPTDHPLARDATDGITLDRAWEIVHHYVKSK